MYSNANSCPGDTRVGSTVQPGMAPYDGESGLVEQKEKHRGPHTTGKYCSPSPSFNQYAPTIAPKVCATIYKMLRGSVLSPAKKVAIVMLGFKCPPEAGAAAKMNNARPVAFKRPAYKLIAMGDTCKVVSPDAPAPSAKTSRQVNAPSTTAIFQLSRTRKPDGWSASRIE